MGAPQDSFQISEIKFADLAEQFPDSDKVCGDFEENCRKNVQHVTTCIHQIIYCFRQNSRTINSLHGLANSESKSLIFCLLTCQKKIFSPNSESKSLIFCSLTCQKYFSPRFRDPVPFTRPDFT